MYSPFDKPIDRLAPKNLETLNSVNEGWYVEYKREAVNSKSLAKSVSAFANTYGGWLFLGVQEIQSAEKVVDTFPGVPQKDVDKTLQRLRSAVSSLLSPSPRYRTKVLNGPCKEIGLAQDVAVIVIEVPQSLNTPHIHVDGRIYRRVADSSDPKPETDRFILDQMWRRGNRVRKVVRRWIKQDPEFSKAESENSYLRLLLCIDPWFQSDGRLSEIDPQLRSILFTTEEDRGAVSAPFDTLFYMPEGLVARQVKDNDPHNVVITLKLRWDLSCDVILPLNCLNPLGASASDGYRFQEQFESLLDTQGYKNPTVIDMNFLFYLLISTVSKYRRILELAEVSCEFYFKPRALNVHRKIPFLDTKGTIKQFESNGIPLIQEQNLQIFAGYDPESFVHVQEFDDTEPHHVSSSVQAFLMFSFISRMFGLDISPAEQIHVDEIISTGKRAKQVQLTRQKKRESDA